MKKSTIRSLLAASGWLRAPSCQCTKNRRKLHSVEVQVHADSKAKFLWMTSHYGPGS